MCRCVDVLCCVGEKKERRREERVSIYILLPFAASLGMT